MQNTKRPTYQCVVFIAISFFTFTPYCASAVSRCNGPEDRPTELAPWLGANFPTPSAMTDEQRNLLNGYLAKQEKFTSYEKWVQERDDHASAFFAVTLAHSRTDLKVGKNQYVTSLSMFDEVTQIHGDRIFVRLNPELFNAWRANGGEFIIHRADNKDETGKVNFNTGDRGGSLHCGNDIQGYTSISKVPRLQWNYNETTHIADLDIDGYAPWVGGIIPNPNHLSWENSDVRYWVGSFTKKFGDPGFDIVKR